MNDGQTCPNCKKPLSERASYCKECGFRRRNLYIPDEIKGPEPFPYWLILAFMLVIPLGTIGACSLGFTVKGPDALNVPFFIICGSMGIGLLMALVNLVKATWRRP